MEVTARPRWPLDEKKANSEPIHAHSIRKGARA